jgi:hypothetical protein
MCWRYREYMPPPTYFSRTTCVLSRVCFTDSAHESRSIPMLLIYFDVSEEGPREAALTALLVAGGRLWYRLAVGSCHAVGEGPATSPTTRLVSSTSRSSTAARARRWRRAPSTAFFTRVASLVGWSWLPFAEMLERGLILNNSLAVAVVAY